MTKIKDLKEKDRLVGRYLIKSCTKGTTSKVAPYLNLVLQDNSGSMDAKFWDVKPEDEKNADAGKVVDATIEVILYNHALQMRVNRITPVMIPEEEMKEYVQASEIDDQVMRKDVYAYAESIRNDKLRRLVLAMLARTQEKFFEYPAASRIHHGYMGGLAEHTLGMADTADAVCRQYPQLNRDLLIAGVLIHDMGKTAELGGLVSSEYSLEGRLTGHISICHGWLTEEADKLGLGDSEEALCLRHMVLSHHGKLEYGSPVPPMLMEAEVLNLIDNLDARMNTLKQAFDTLEKGQWTTRLFALENRQFYKPKM